MAASELMGKVRSAVVIAPLPLVTRPKGRVLFRRAKYAEKPVSTPFVAWNSTTLTETLTCCGMPSWGAMGITGGATKGTGSAVACAKAAGPHATNNSAPASLKNKRRRLYVSDLIIDRIPRRIHID
jgi:hypothetical protein